VSKAEPLSQWDKQLGERLRQARLQALRTQDEAARALAVDRTTLAKWELGQRRMSAYDLSQLAALYQVPLRQLVELERPLSQPAIVGDATADASAAPADQARRMVGQLLEQRPDLLPAVLEHIENMLTTTKHATTVAGTSPGATQALARLQSLDVNQTAPLAALQLLAELQRTLADDSATK
jgi:transcriptional regulator with XRE-family HTH domain